MTYLIINYSWHLSFLRGSGGVSDNARVCLKATPLVSLRRRKGVYLVEVYIQYQTLAGKGIPGIPLSFQPVCHGGKQVALQLINKLEALWFSLRGCREAKRNASVAENMVTSKNPAKKKQCASPEKDHKRSDK